ncbi:MAG: ATP-binding protein [Anaerolineae bacterium]
MKTIRDMSIGTKVLISPLVLIVALGAVSLLAVYGLNAQRATYRAVNEIALQKVSLIDKFTLLSEQVQSDVFLISVIRFMELPDDEFEPVYARLEQGLSDMNVIYGQILTRWPLDDTEQALLQQMQEPLAEFGKQARQAADVVSDNPSFGVLLVRSSTIPFSQFRRALGEFKTYQQQKITRAETESNQRAQTLSTVIMAVSLLITLAGIVTTTLIGTHLISSPIHAMTDLMRRLAHGDLTIQVGGLNRGDEIGAMARAVEVFRDNAIAKAGAEKALEAAERRYRTLFEEAPVMYVITRNQEGHPIVTDCNQLFARTLGYERHEILSRPLADFYTPDSQRELLDRGGYRRALNGHFVPEERQLVARDGAVIDTILQASPEQETDAITGTRAMFVDITGRKQAQKRLKDYSERLEDMVQERTRELQDAQEQLVRREKLAVLGQLAGGIAHELRNPLGSIKNAVYFLNLALESPDPETREMLGIMEREVRVSERIITSLLDFARSRPPVRHRVRVNQAVSSLLAQTAIPENVQLTTRLNPLLPDILADPDQLARIMGNLIHNAIQAMPQGGKLVVESAASGDGGVAITVTDSGTGIPAEARGKIFEPLFTTKARGIGLGLAMVKSLVKGHGGTVTVESEPGKGSAFTVVLPAGTVTGPEGEGLNTAQ